MQKKVKLESLHIAKMSKENIKNVQGGQQPICTWGTKNTDDLACGH